MIITPIQLYPSTELKFHLLDFHFSECEDEYVLLPWNAERECHKKIAPRDFIVLNVFRVFHYLCPSYTLSHILNNSIWPCELPTKTSSRQDWKRISAESSAMSPRRPNWSRDWTELIWPPYPWWNDIFLFSFHYYTGSKRLQALWAHLTHADQLHQNSVRKYNGTPGTDLPINRLLLL